MARTVRRQNFQDNRVVTVRAWLLSDPLQPVLYNLADQLGFHVATIVNGELDFSIELTWMLMVRDPEAMHALSNSIGESLLDSGVAYRSIDRSFYRKIKPWTDDFSNLLDVIQ